MAARIPKLLPEFDEYLPKVDNYVNALEPDGITKRGITLGMTTGELTQLSGFRLQWRSGDPANPGIYDIHDNDDLKNRKSRLEAENIVKNFTAFFRPLLVIMAASRHITIADRLALNIAEPGVAHTKPTTPIPQQCYVHITLRGGGDLKFDCKATLDSTRASLPKNANGVEFAYRIYSPQFVPPFPAVTDGAGNDLASKIKREQLISPDDGTDKKSYTKASFVVKLGPENAGNNLQFFARWINTHYPGLEGPWTGPVSLMIS